MSLNKPFFKCSNMCSGGGNLEKVNMQTPKGLSQTWRKKRARFLRRYLLWGLAFPLTASELGVQVWKLLPGTGNLRSIPRIKHFVTGQEGRRPICCARAPSLIYRFAFDPLCNDQSESLLLLQGHLWGKTRRHDDRHTESKITTEPASSGPSSLF